MGHILDFSSQFNLLKMSELCSYEINYAYYLSLFWIICFSYFVNINNNYKTHNKQTKFPEKFFAGIKFQGVK